MLKKLANHSLIDSRDRVKYASDSMSLTIWYNNDSSIFAFEVVYDLLMNEKCFFYSRKTVARYSNIIDDESKVGRSKKQIIANKDIKLRTFITQESGRAQLVSHVYDITYGVIRAREDALVCIDDSIVRGTTLKKSILQILGRSKPTKLLIASTAPQIRYPDCYGIDMSELGKFIAFQAAVALINERGYDGLLAEVAAKCKEALKEPKAKLENHVKRVYENFTASEISAKVAELVKPDCLNGTTEVKVVYQSIENLHEALPDHSGDWYFTGDYPTPGGYRVVHKAFLNYYEDKDGRSY